MRAEVFLPLSQGRVAVIDFEDFERVGRVKWTAKPNRHGNCYALRRVGGRKTSRCIYLHEAILGHKRVDHRDGDGLNNRRENLRPATQREQARAFRRKAPGKSSEYRGVTWNKNRKTWQAQVCFGTTTRIVGQFKKEMDAALAYDSAALGLGFDIRACNFPP